MSFDRIVTKLPSTSCLMLQMTRRLKMFLLFPPVLLPVQIWQIHLFKTFILFQIQSFRLVLVSQVSWRRSSSLQKVLAYIPGNQLASWKIKLTLFQLGYPLSFTTWILSLVGIFQLIPELLYQSFLILLVTLPEQLVVLLVPNYKLQGKILNWILTHLFNAHLRCTPQEIRKLLADYSDILSSDGFTASYPKHGVFHDILFLALLSLQRQDIWILISWPLPRLSSQR